MKTRPHLRHRPSSTRARGQSRPAWLAALAIAGAAGCDADFGKGSEVDSLRVLAVQVDSPFAGPGDTVRLQALAHDPLERPITWAWALCSEPASSSVESCLADVAQTTLATGAAPLVGMGVGADSVEIDIPADAISRLPPPARPQALLGVLSVACPGSLELAPGVDHPELPFRCTEPETGRELALHEAILGLKRVFLRESDRHSNPVIERILFDGEDWGPDDVKEIDGCETAQSVFDDCPQLLRHRVQALVADASFEAGTDEFGRAFTEQLIVQHYTESGIFEDEVRIASDAETGWVSRNIPGEHRLWFVARDDRGGVSWEERRVRVR